MAKALIVAGAAVVGATYVKVVAAERSQRREEDGAVPGQADAIVVFGGQCYERGPAIEVCDRLNHAVDLYQRGVAPQILLSGGVDARVDEVEVMRRYLVRKGVPESATGEARPGDNSRQTISALDPATTYVAVSSAYHAHRIGAEARRQGKHVIVNCAPDSIDLRNPRVLRVQRASEVAATMLYASPEWLAGSVRRVMGRLRHSVPDTLKPGSMT